MATSKPNWHTFTRQLVWFYGAVTIINVAIIGMFLLVTTPPPALAVAPHFTHRLRPKVIIQGVPVRIVVPSLAIDLPVRTGSYNTADQTWTIDTAGAFYADMSVPANNNNGTTLIYAHGRDGLFGSLPSITPGAKAVITTASGGTFTYTYQSVVEVNPDDTSLFDVTTAPTLILQTCSGDWSQFRALYSFSLTEVHSS